MHIPACTLPLAPSAKICVDIQQCSQAQLVRADSHWFPPLQAEAGFRCSAGISSNRMLAKLVSGLHKPDDQTALLPPDVLEFVAPLPVRALPGKALVWMQVHGSISRPFGEMLRTECPETTVALPSPQRISIMLVVSHNKAFACCDQHQALSWSRITVQKPLLPPQR